MDSFPSRPKAVHVGDCSEETLPHLTDQQLRNVKKQLEIAIQTEKKFLAQVEAWQKRYDNGDTDETNWDARANISYWTCVLEDVKARRS